MGDSPLPLLPPRSPPLPFPPLPLPFFGSVAQWLGRQSFAGGLSMIYV